MSKRLLSIIAFLFCLCVLLPVAQAKTIFDYNADLEPDIFKNTVIMNIDQTNFIIDGEVKSGAMTRVQNGTAFVPLRALFTALGYQVQWDANTKTALLTAIDQQISIQSDGTVYKNGQKLPSKAQLINFQGQLCATMRSAAAIADKYVEYKAGELGGPSLLDNKENKYKLIFFSDAPIFNDHYYSTIEYTALYWAISAQPVLYGDRFLIAYPLDNKLHIFSWTPSRQDYIFDAEQTDNESIYEKRYVTKHGDFWVSYKENEGDSTPVYRYQNNQFTKIIDQGLIYDIKFNGDYMYLLFHSYGPDLSYIANDHSNLLQINLKDLSQKYLGPGPPYFVYGLSDSTWEIKENGVYISGFEFHIGQYGESNYYLVDIYSNSQQLLN